MKKLLAIAALLATSAIANEVPKTIELKTETINAVMQYLGTKPYQETAALIQQIQRESQEYINSINAKKAKKAEPKKGK